MSDTEHALLPDIYRSVLWEAVYQGYGQASKFLLTETLTALHSSLSWAESAMSNLKKEGGDVHPDKLQGG